MSPETFFGAVSFLDTIGSSAATGVGNRYPLCLWRYDPPGQLAPQECDFVWCDADQHIVSAVIDDAAMCRTHQLHGVIGGHGRTTGAA